MNLSSVLSILYFGAVWAFSPVKTLSDKKAQPTYLGLTTHKGHPTTEQGNQDS